MDQQRGTDSEQNSLRSNTKLVPFAGETTKFLVIPLEGSVIISRMASPILSGNDASVLSALFDPEASISNPIRLDASRPTENQLTSIQEEEIEALREINQENPSSSDVTAAIAKLTDIITSHPEYASAWNNRAQAKRLLIMDEDLPVRPHEVADIVNDLGQAIQLATPKHSTEPIPLADAKVLASAHTHLGYLLLLASKGHSSLGMISAIPGFKQLSSIDLEEMASRELAAGGRYGNETARQLAVKTNPYAKLCGSIVREALQKEISDYKQRPVD